MRDSKLSTKDVIVILHSIRWTHWKVYINEHYFDSNGY